MFVPHIDAVMDRQSYRRTDGRLTERLTERERESTAAAGSIARKYQRN